MEVQGEVLAEAAVTAWAAVRLPSSQCEPLRPQPGPVHVKPLGPKTLRFADEQTVAGMAAILHAIHNHKWHDRSFVDWGVVGVPRFLGRTVIAYNIAQSARDPAFSISPHVIPNQCLHSLSGAVSVAFGIHGPNFGVGGGPNAVAEGLVTGLSLMSERRLPGLWLVFTEFDPEPIPQPSGQPANEPIVHAAALALELNGSGRSIRLIQDGGSQCAASVRSLAGFLEQAVSDRWECGLPGLGTIELTSTCT